MLNAAVLIFDEVEVLDFCGPFEVLASTRAPGSSLRREREPAFNVFTVAAKSDVVRCRGGLLVTPNYTFETCPVPDVMVVPGGFGVLAAQKDAATVDWVRRSAASCRAATSVCTGAFLLAAAGLLDGQPATTHWAEIEAMREQYGDRVDVRDDYRVVDLGNVITSAGVSAGLDMTLHLIEKLFDRRTAEESARSIEYTRSPVRTLVA